MLRSQQKNHPSPPVNVCETQREKPIDLRERSDPALMIIMVMMMMTIW